MRQPLLSGLANPTVKPAEPLLLDGTNPTVELVESLYCLGITGIPFETRIYFLFFIRESIDKTHIDIAASDYHCGVPENKHVT